MAASSQLALETNRSTKSKVEGASVGGLHIPRRLQTFLDWAHALVITPFVLTNFTVDIVLLVFFPFARPSPGWSLNQAVRMRVVKLALLYMSILKTAHRIHLRPGKERNRFEILHPGEPRLYRGPLQPHHNASNGDGDGDGDDDVNSGIIQPAIIGTTWTPALPTTTTTTDATHLAKQHPGGDDVMIALHFHGGGFALGTGRDEDTGFLARTFLQHLGVTHVSTPQYRLSSCPHPPNHFPAPVQDALTAYLDLIHTKKIPPRQIILSGDSAGGNIALALARYISEYGGPLGIPPPGGIALWSPWVDVHAATDATLDVKMSPHYETDFICTEFARWGAGCVLGGSSSSGTVDVDARGAYLSPLHHPFRLVHRHYAPGGRDVEERRNEGEEEEDGEKEIPLFIHAGECEVLVDDLRNFKRLLRDEAGWKKVHLEIARYCPHDIVLVGDKIGFEKEAAEAVGRAGRFFQEMGVQSFRRHVSKTLTMGGK